MIQIKNRAEESDDGEDDDHAAYYLIDNDDAVGIKLVPNLVDEPGESEPPQQGSEDDAEIPYSHFYRHIRYDEGKLREGGHEEEHDERIGECYEERRDAIVHQGTLLVARLVHVLHRVALEAVDSEYEEHQTAENLKIKLVLRVTHKSITKLMPKPVNKAYTMSLNAAPTPVTNPYQRPLLSVRWMQGCLPDP